MYKVYIYNIFGLDWYIWFFIRKDYEKIRKRHFWAKNKVSNHKTFINIIH